MPISTFPIAADADDGAAQRNYDTSLSSTVTWFVDSGINVNVFNRTTSPDWAYTNAWFRFSGITIPQNTTINSAALKPYGQTTAPVNLRIQVASAQTPGNPTGVAGVFTPAALSTIATGGLTGTGGTAGVKDDYVPQDYDVTALVQTLVNDFDYSNGEMVFYVNVTSANTGGNLYFRDWGTATTSLGGMPKSASLVINYGTNPPPTKTTFHHG